MAEELLSPSWYRVADLRPRLRSHARIHRHEYRGDRWYVLEDRISRRSHRMAQRKTLGTMLSPLAIKFPLLDPDRLLDRWLPWYRPLFGPFGLLLWLTVVGTGLVLMVQHWNELTQDVSDRVLAPENLVIMLLVFPVLKAIHEFGHACAVKAWGGEV